MVKLTGSDQYKGQQSQARPGPVKLTMRLHLRIFVGTLMRKIYTTIMIQNGDGEIDLEECADLLDQKADQYGLSKKGQKLNNS